MKVLTILGTRPEIIRLSRIVPRLDEVCEHVLVHTGQNFDPALSDVFFKELGVRQPDESLGVRAATFGEEAGQILAGCEKVIRERCPERLLVLGDTNSGLAAIVAKRLGVPVYHMEAGNRCFDDRVPEEINRRLIDHSSDVLLPYTERSRMNLLREGIHPQRIVVTGNPIYEVIRYYAAEIEASNVLGRLDVAPQEYFLATVHRQENVDVESRLASLLEAFALLSVEYEVPVVCSVHPRTRSRLAQFGMSTTDDRVRFHPPLGFFDFVSLERNAKAVLTDSGTVQEECCIFGVPTVTVRDVTERQETVECGSNILSGVDPSRILDCVRTALTARAQWSPPPEYLVDNVSRTVAKVVTGHFVAGHSRAL